MEILAHREFAGSRDLRIGWGRCSYRNQNLGAGQVEAADIGHVVYISFSSRNDQFSLLEMDECGALDPTTDEDGSNKLIDEPSQFSTG